MNSRVSKQLLTGSVIGLLSLASSFTATAHGNHKHGQQNLQTAEFVVLQVTKQGPQIKRIHSDGRAQVLYTVPKGDRLFQLAHSPDKPLLLISYLKKETSEQGIWQLEYNPDGKANEDPSTGLSAVLVDKDPNTFYFDPLLQHDGDGVYFISAQIDEKTNRASKNLRLSHYNPEDGQQKLIAKNATHPSFSEQGKYLTWLERNSGTSEVNVMRTDTSQIRRFQITHPKTIVRFAKVNEQLNSLFFFSNKEQLLAQALRFSQWSAFDLLIPKANAHSGHKHADSFGWQLPLDNNDISQSQLSWEVQDIRAFDISPDGKQVAWLNSDGLHIVDIASKKNLKTIRNPNYWKLVYVHQLFNRSIKNKLR